MPQRASIQLTPQGIQLRIEYNSRAIQALKSLIPPNDRTYDSDSRTWIVFDVTRRGEIERLLANFYPEINGREVRVHGELST